MQLLCPAAVYCVLRLDIRSRFTSRFRFPSFTLQARASLTLYFVSAAEGLMRQHTCTWTNRHALDELHSLGCLKCVL